MYFPNDAVVQSGQEVSLGRLWTHQVIQHPHQRLKLQLPGLPLDLAGHVDVTCCVNVGRSRFVLLPVQHDQVVHAAGTRDGLHLNPHSKEEGTERVNLWWRLVTYVASIKWKVLFFLINNQAHLVSDHPPLWTTQRDKPPCTHKKDVILHNGNETTPPPPPPPPPNLNPPQHQGIYSSWHATPMVGGFIYRN